MGALVGGVQCKLVAAACECVCGALCKLRSTAVDLCEEEENNGRVQPLTDEAIFTNFHTYEHQKIIIIKIFKNHFKNLRVDTFKQRCQPELLFI